MPDAPSPGASLTVLGGPLKGKTLLLEDAVDEILVGSDPDSKLCLDVPGVSPIHARIWLDLAGAKVYDTRSPRGLYINDARVQGEAPLHDGDILWLGPPGEAQSVMIRYRAPSDLDAVQPAQTEPAVSAPGDDEPILFAGDDPVVEPAPEPSGRDSFALGDEELSFAEPPVPARAPAAPSPPAVPAPPPAAEGEPLAGLLDDFAFLEEPMAAPPPPKPAAPPPPSPPAPAAPVDDF